MVTGRAALRWPWPPVVVDALVAVVVAVPVVLDAWWNKAGTRQADAVTYALVAVSVAALLVRRRWPGAVAVVCGLAATAWYLLGHHGEVLNLPTMVALYTVADRGDRRRSLAVGVVAVVWSGAVAALAERPFGAPGSAPVLEVVWPVIALLLGEVTRSRRQLLAEYRDRVRRAEADREREARLRVEEERLRIARELHDVVAHTVAAMQVQAGVAADAFDVRPDLARQALAQVRSSGREALGELHAVVAVLRDDDATGDGVRPGGPAPGLGQLGELAAPLAGAGLDVTVAVDVGPAPLPAPVELAAYRIVQEALTNAVRHARARHVAVSVARRDGVVVVDVTDDGVGPAGPRSPGQGGFGLLGMGERVASVGGHLDHGAGPGGGFRVRATLPVGGEGR